MTLLEVDDLHVVYSQSNGPDVHAVRGISFEFDENETFGLVGESGCGKTTVANAILRSLPDNGRVTGGEIVFDGQNLLELSQEEIRELRWEKLSMIPQSAMASLNKVYTVGAQIREAIQAHRDGVSDDEAIDRARDLLEMVGIDGDRVSSYPHELSGGMRQRAIIAMALALDPKLVVADEPTTALDVIIQGQILHRIRELQNELGIAMLMITHDISVVAETCDKVGVMYGGELMEVGTTHDIFDDAHHPYTLGLQNGFPSIEGEVQDLVSIPGAPPDLSDPPSGCPFLDRCPFGSRACSQPLPTEELDDGHVVRCHEPVPYEEMRARSGQREIWQSDTRSI
jgi:oligopeptide/dipeptide ABC transporter ATP-binding protein